MQNTSGFSVIEYTTESSLWEQSGDLISLIGVSFEKFTMTSNRTKLYLVVLFSKQGRNPS